MNLDFTRMREVPYDIQRVGTTALVRWNQPEVGRVWPGCFALFDDMGLGKSKQTIDSAHYLYEGADIDRVIVIAPAAVRDNWFDKELGELAKHLWKDVRHRVIEFHGKNREWFFGAGNGKPLVWIVTNYEFIRSAERLKELKQYVTRNTLLVLDESSLVKSHNAQQARAVLELRQGCRRVTLLNGTPIVNGAGDMYMQGAIMDPRIMDCKNFYVFRSRYAEMGGYLNRQITGWRNVEDIQKRFAPYVLRRLTEDSVDLPEKMPPVMLFAELKPSTWRLYKQMRDDMVAWLDHVNMSMATQAGVKALRLAQICSGFLGGVDALPGALGPETEDDAPPDWMGFEEPTLSPDFPSMPIINGDAVQEIGSEKVHVLSDWYARKLTEDPSFKLLLWCRFRPEVERYLRMFANDYPKVELGAIYGGQKKADRARARMLLDPRTAPPGPVVDVGTPATGSMGLTLTASHTMVYSSNDFNLKTRLQSEKRTHRIGQDKPCSYFDIVAVGPNGQKTIDYKIIMALRNKDNMAKWTTDAWRKALLEE